MRWVMLAVAAVLAAGAAWAAPLEAYGKLPIMDQVSISPDGGKIAFVQPVGGMQTVVIDSLNPAALIANLPPTDLKVRKLIWADPANLLVVVSKESMEFDIKAEWYLVQDLDLRTRKIVPLLGKVAGGMRALSGMPEVRTRAGKTTVFAPSYFFKTGSDPSRQVAVPALMTVDLSTGVQKLEQVGSLGRHRTSWTIDDQGAVIAVSDYDEDKHAWGMAVWRGGAWAPGYAQAALTDAPDVTGLSPDGASVVLEMYRENWGYEFRRLSLADGKLSAPESTFSAVASFIQDAGTDRVIGGLKLGLEPSYVFFDPKDQAVWDLVVNLFPDEYVDFVSWSRDRGKAVVRVTGLKHGIVYELVDTASHHATPIGQARPDIGPSDLSEVQIATYPAKDGTPIRAFLTLPNGRDPKNLPLIVLPHGGPADHDEAGFDWWAQALASRGYAVLQPQFRGSSGLSWALESAGFGEWGRKMQTDLSDGVRALASKGYIDPKRVCIVGASYGGYAALAGVTLEQGVYRCAVSVGGVSDLRTQIGGPKADAEHSRTVRYWDRFMGARAPTDPILDQLSPSRHAAEASAPILLIHGKDDTVVPIQQSQIMETALKRAGKPVEFVALKNEDHWLSREATRLEMLQATVTFLEKNNPPR